jgi:hypothetical protein
MTQFFNFQTFRELCYLIINSLFENFKLKIEN